MAWDTKYRPQKYEDVVGQHGTVVTLKGIVSQGKGYHQSYVLSGKHGGGKTTIARILARALLCDKPVEGAPCDQCPSCLSILQSGTSDALTEIDAASTGKDDVELLKETLKYDTFSGKRRILIIDEAHELSRAAQDALLKVLEDTIPGSQDKILVCLFCTTELSKIRATIRSRCLSFAIKTAPLDALVGRLGEVCTQEGVPYEVDALATLVAYCDAHIRDALKLAEGVSITGAITQERVSEYLGLNANRLLIDLLGHLGSDLGSCLNIVETVGEVLSPTDCYQRLVQISMLAYRAQMGVLGQIPKFWDLEALRALGAKQGDKLITVANTLSRRPGKPTLAMLQCDLGLLHHTNMVGNVTSIVTVTPVMVQEQSTIAKLPDDSPKPDAQVQIPFVASPPVVNPPTVSSSIHTASTNPYDGVYLYPRIQAPQRAQRGQSNGQGRALPPMSPEDFGRLLQRHVAEYQHKKGAVCVTNGTQRPG